MTNSIRETVHTALVDAGYAGYESYADGVIARLEERDEEIAALITERAQDAGLAEDQVYPVLQEAGLVQAPVQEESLYDGEAPTGGFDIASLNDALERALRPIQDQVHRLTEAARSRGISV